MRRTLIISLLALLASYTAIGKPIWQPAQSQTEMLGQLEYMRHIDPLTLDEVQALEEDVWVPVERSEANFGFDMQHYWFRIPILPPYSSSTPWYLRFSYPLLDQVDVYLYDSNRLVQEFHTGDTLPFADRPIPHQSFVFPLILKKTELYWAYIHVYTSSSVQLPISLLEESNFWKTIAAENAIAAAFYSILLCMLAYNAVLFVMVRERSYFYYVLYIASFTILMASIHGWSYPILWPNNPLIHEKSVVISLSATICFAALFGAHFLRLREVRPDLYRLIYLVTYISAACGFSAIFLPYGLAIKITTVLGLVATIIAMFSTAHEWYRSRAREVMLFLMAWLFLLFGFSLYIGQKLGVLPVNAITEHAIEIGAVIEVLLLALGLADKINSERKGRLAAQQEMLELQIKANEQLDKKVRERTEELELLNGQLQLASVTDSLTQVKNRRYFDKKLPAEYRRSFREKSWISLLMLDIDHFKSFNDTFGHQAGDKVLQEVAKVVEEVVKRPCDAVSRYGGEEFAVLLPNTPIEGAILVAERVRVAIESLAVEWQDQTLSVTASIGISGCIPSHRDEFEILTQQADNFLYVAKEQGRNCAIHPGNDPSAQPGNS